MDTGWNSNKDTWTYPWENSINPVETAQKTIQYSQFYCSLPLLFAAITSGICTYFANTNYVAKTEFCLICILFFMCLIAERIYLSENPSPVITQKKLKRIRWALVTIPTYQIAAITIRLCFFKYSLGAMCREGDMDIFGYIIAHLSILACLAILWKTYTWRSRLSANITALHSLVTIFCRYGLPGIKEKEPMHNPSGSKWDTLQYENIWVYKAPDEPDNYVCCSSLKPETLYKKIAAGKLIIPNRIIYVTRT